MKPGSARHPTTAAPPLPTGRLPSTSGVDSLDFDPEATMCAGDGDRGGWVAVEAGDATRVGPDQRVRPGGESAGEDLTADLVEEVADELVGVVLGSYRLLDLLGEGGMGKVYLAEHVKIGRKVAIKLLRAQYASRPEIVSSFFQEARAVNQIRHENIIDITDFVEDQDGHSYLVMELLSGVDFSDHLRRAWPLPLERVLHIFIQIADGLSSAHEVGIVHRDLKPDNVFLLTRGQNRDFVKLLDFGVSKLMSQAMADYGRGRVVGTPAYMSPEQASGSADVDHRADVYALGGMLYRVCAGKPPFRGKKIEDYVRLHCVEPPLPPNQVPGLPQPIPARLEALILRCLAKKPEERFQTMHELSAELRAVRDELSATKAAAEWTPAVARPPRRSRMPVWAAAASALIGGTAATIFLLQSNRTEKAAAVPIEVEALPDEPASASAPARPSGPTAEPAAATPDQVRISFASRPEGAEVWRAADTAGLPVGVTPFSMTVPAEPRDEAFVFKVRGWAPATVSASLRADGTVEAKLLRASGHKRPGPGDARPPAGAAKSTTKKLDVTDRLDPFAGGAK